MTIELKADGKIFGGWLTASVTRSLNAVSGSFEISYLDKWKDQNEPWPLKAGGMCQLTYKGIPLITGFIDEVSTSYDSSTRSLSVSGRDKTGDLVDSAGKLEARFFRGVSLAKMASVLASPFGVSVSADSGAANASIKNVSLQNNETIWETISRLAKYQNVLAYPDAQGGIVFADVGSENIGALIEGENILTCSVAQNDSEKFQTYRIFVNVGDANTKHKKMIADVTDNSVKRPRLKLIASNKAITKAEAIERAKWEMASRIAKSFTLTICVTSWLDSSGKLWEINKLVTVKSPKCGVEGTFLIEETRFTFDDGGYKTELKLVHKEAYKPTPDRAGSSVGEMGEV